MPNIVDRSPGRTIAAAGCTCAVILLPAPTQTLPVACANLTGAAVTAARLWRSQLSLTQRDLVDIGA